MSLCSNFSPILIALFTLDDRVMYSTEAMHGKVIGKRHEVIKQNVFEVGCDMLLVSD